MAGDTPNVIVMNDTSTRHHHGCSRVMRLLVAAIEARGARIIARSPARHDWARDNAFLQHLGDADLIVINGEGTMHHGRPAAERLLDVAGHPVRRGKLALINALWQDNPAAWNAQLRQFDLLAARDAASAQELSAAAGMPVRTVPDLSLSAPVDMAPTPRQGLIVGDSVKFDVRRALARAAIRLDATYVPTKTLSSRLWHSSSAKWALFCAYNGVLAATPRFEIAPDEARYLERLIKAEGHLTGRFHAVCMSLLTQTPFIAVTSNARKIEALLADAGLSSDRILSQADVAKLTRADITRPFTPDETAAITAFLGRARQDASTLSDDLAALACEGQKERAS